MKGIKIKAGQIWIDKKKGDRMEIVSRHHDIYWNCIFERSKRKNHKMNEGAIKKFYTLYE